MLRLLIALMLLLVWSPAYAATDNAATQLLDLVFEILMVVVPVVAVWLTHRGIKVFEAQTKIDIPDSIEQQIDLWVEKGIHLAAEKSRQKAKEKTAKLTGSEKLETAADFVFKMAHSRGWVDWPKDKIKAKINAAIGEHRASGTVPKLEE